MDINIDKIPIEKEEDIPIAEKIKEWKASLTRPSTNDVPIKELGTKSFTIEVVDEKVEIKTDMSMAEQYYYLSMALKGMDDPPELQILLERLETLEKIITQRR